MQKKYKKAFSLVELSIVILITSILITGALGVSKTSKNNEKAKITKERMDIVYDALTAFVAQNRRLPCPADLRVAKGTAEYGTEGTTPGTCENTFKTSNGSAVNIEYGMVPIAALGIDPDFAEDGFGTKFSFVVDRRFTRVSTSISDTLGFEITKSAINETDALNLDLGGLNIYGAGVANILPNQNGVLALISHGANKLGGYNASGTAQNTFATNGQEQDNSCSGSGNITCPLLQTGTATFNDSFGVSSTDPNFDDIVMFKTKVQLVKDAGMEFIMCNMEEATTAATNTTCLSDVRNWATNGTYGEDVPYAASGAVCMKTCGKYGIWSMAKESTEVYFSAHRKLNTGSVTGNGTNHIVRFNEMIYPEEEPYYYNKYKGIFTAPVTGTYLFNYGVGFTNIHSRSRYTNNFNSTIEVYLMVNNENNTSVMYHMDDNDFISSSDYLKFGNNSTTVFLQKDDFVSIKARSNGTYNAVIIVGDSNKSTNFSGKLLK